MTDRPNPGSDAAIALGCTCPIYDNAHGIGYMGVPGNFVFTARCPVHDPDGGMLRAIKEWQRNQIDLTLPHSEDDA